jgi:undecaprenyl-diphosphatase
VDWRIYHAVNVWVSHHSWIGRTFGQIEKWGVPVIAVATVALWLLSRPGGDRRWKLASVSALGAAAIALFVNQVIGHIWHRARPFESHHVAKIWVPRSHDPSFPSDHASAAFAIAFAVLLFDRVAGALFMLAAVLVGGGRVIAGAHYLTDILAGAAVGLAVALLVVRLARPAVDMIVRLVERVTDPLLRPLWRARRA